MVVIVVENLSLLYALIAIAWKMMVTFFQDIVIKIMLEQHVLKNGYMMGSVMKETMLKNVILMKMIVALESKV